MLFFSEVPFAVAVAGVAEPRSVIASSQVMKILASHTISACPRLSMPVRSSSETQVVQVVDLTTQMNERRRRGRVTFWARSAKESKMERVKVIPVEPAMRRVLEKDAKSE